ncbi:conserved hypothetical protein [Hyphomicrobiales bacterium]|nr:conserved hypothetical protein [Hyphomicrobiales bacterium]CAH1700483.1 conserved hypothetical protein [Hyphomicrobiales bacterium]CAI0343637.1 conserved hypothetical protein [Hyphomicrobiales bacterium]
MRTHTTMQARSGDGAFLARVNGAAFAGVVHSAFRRAVNIACLCCGELHTLVTDELDDGPNSLVVATEDFLAVGICQGDSVRAGGGSLAIAGKVMVNVAGAAVWRTPAPATHCAAGLLRRRLAEAETAIWRSGTPGGFIEGMADTEVARFTTRMLHEAADGLALALGRDDIEAALGHASRLIGLGPGLTPSGDDFLVGLLAARALCRRQGDVGSDRFALGVARLAKAETNPISYAAIAKAARGEVRERVARLIIALCSATGAPLPPALEQVLAIGSSSGTEIAFGVIRGLASLIDNGEWEHGHQDRH